MWTTSLNTKKGVFLSLGRSSVPMLPAENMRTQRDHICQLPTGASCANEQLRMSTTSLSTKKGVFISLGLQLGSSADSQKHEKANDHIRKLSPGASCANAQLRMWTTSFSTKKVCLVAWFGDGKPWAPRKVCLIAWFAAGIAWPPRRVCFVTWIADGEGGAPAENLDP